MSDTVSPHPPSQPIPQATAWTQTLEAIAAQPLTLCADFPAIARRHEAFWAQAVIDRPLFLASINADSTRPVTKRLDLLGEPDAWFEAKLADMRQIHRVGDTLPSIRPDLGPVALGGMFGGAVTLSAETDTTWTHAHINADWSNAPDWTIHEDNRFWNLMCDLTRRVAADAAGRYLVFTTVLGGTADILANLRGSGALCMDVIEQPEKIAAAVDAIYPSWRRAFTAIYETITCHGAGLVHNAQLWSNQPYDVAECDFNALIGPRDFERLFLPDIARRAATAGRTIFHLDGPDAARHLDALLEVPEIQAIQYVTGEGTPSALAKRDMLRKIQARGRALQITCPFDEVLPLCDELRPEGLALIVRDIPDRASLDSLFAQFCRRYGCTA